MKHAFIRSNIFNLLFYILTAIACILCLPALVLPRRFFMGVVHFFVHKVYFLERLVLGLNYEVRGHEHLPKDGSYIVAAKHQSPYETLKLHMLFKDPAVILKKELLSIPLWGMYLKKSDPIAIDRATPDAAIASIQEGAKRVKEQGRPIIIFPQGTRVNPDQTPEDKPYKVGVARIQEATDLPIIPMALNAGLFWPRAGWLKSSGRVIFSFLEPIQPGLERQDLIKKLEKEIEDESLSLMNEEKEKAMDKSGGGAFFSGIFLLILALFGLYSFAWFTVADEIKKQYPMALQDLSASKTAPASPAITGYPGKLSLHVEREVLDVQGGTVIIEDISAQGWPIPFLPITIQTGPINITHFKWDKELNFDSLSGSLTINGDLLTIEESALKQGEFDAAVAGTIDMAQEPVPALDLNVALTKHNALLASLKDNGIIEERMALFIGAGMSSLADPDGVVRVPVTQRKNKIYAGPLPIMTLPPASDRNSRQPSRRPLQPASAPDSDNLQAPSPQSPGE